MTTGDMAHLTDLAGKTALVTGASSNGLGRHFALTLARAGADIVIAARRKDRLEGLAEEVRALGRRALAVALDVTDTASITAAVDEACAEMGRIDILVNNAGVAVSKSFLDHTEEDWDFVVDTNLKGAYLMAQAVARKQAEDGAGGSIINISSLMGLRVLKHLSSYAAAKAGLIQATEAMALELARHDIRVNAIAPGYIITDINRDYLTSAGGERLLKGVPVRRFGDLSDLDGPLLLLAGEGSRYMTGSTIVVDGGHKLAVH